MHLLRELSTKIRWYDISINHLPISMFDEIIHIALDAATRNFNLRNEILREIDLPNKKEDILFLRCKHF